MNDIMDGDFRSGSLFQVTENGILLHFKDFTIAAVESKDYRRWESEQESDIWDWFMLLSLNIFSHEISPSSADEKNHVVKHQRKFLEIRSAWRLVNSYLFLLHFLCD